MKFSILLTVFAVATSIFADDRFPSYVQFYSTGPDKYADGTTVLDDEVYALIWVKDGSTFAGLTAQGALVDAENNKLIAAAPLAKDGHCRNTAFMLNAKDAALANTGAFKVYLLDTRIKGKEGAADKPSGVFAGMTFKAVNTYAEAGNPSAGEGGKDDKPTSNAIGAGSAVASALPADLPMPKVTSILVKDGRVMLTVGDTVPFVRYNVLSGKEPGKLANNSIAKGINGSSDGEIVFEFESNGEDRFFRIVRDEK